MMFQSRIVPKEGRMILRAGVNTNQGGFIILLESREIKVPLKLEIITLKYSSSHHCLTNNTIL